MLGWVQKMRHWYVGTPYKNEHGSPIVFVNHMVRPALAIKIDAMAAWCKKHWQFLVATMIGIIGLFLAK